LQENDRVKNKRTMSAKAGYAAALISESAMKKAENKFQFQHSPINPSKTTTRKILVKNIVTYLLTAAAAAAPAPTPSPRNPATAARSRNSAA